MQNDERFRVSSTPPLVIDMYQLPPLLVITGGPIGWALDQAKCKEERKHIAAMIILGQPFNRNSGERR